MELPIAGKITRRPTSGFTLLEVLIAMGVLAIALVALLGLHARNIGMTIRDQNFTRATLLARDLISEVQFQAMVQGIDSVSSSGGAFDGFPGFRYEMQVDPTDFDDIRRVHLRVIWDERNPNACQVLYFVRGEVL